MPDVLTQFVLILATSVWVGGLVAIAVVARVAHATIDAADRVQFFRAVGRSYGLVGGSALVAGAVLAVGQPWDGPVVACSVVAIALVVTTVVGVAQARG